MRKVMLAATTLAVMLLAVAPAGWLWGRSASGGGDASGGGSSSQAPAPADETPDVDAPAEEAFEEAGEGTFGAADEAPSVDTPAAEAAEAGSVPKAPAQQSGKLPNSGGVSPMALVSVAVLISGAALGVVVLRRRG